MRQRRLGRRARASARRTAVRRRSLRSCCRSTLRSSCGGRSFSKAKPASARPRSRRPWRRRSAPSSSACSATKASTSRTRCTSGTTRGSCSRSGCSRPATSSTIAPTARRPRCARATERLFTEPFLIKRPLLRALQHEPGEVPVLLIDEIDRADEEFEGFLLELLSDYPGDDSRARHHHAPPNRPSSS